MRAAVLTTKSDSAVSGRATDPVGVSWLITVRWTTLVAGVGAVVAGRSALQASIPLVQALAVFGAFTLSNLWLMWQVGRDRTASLAAAGVLICADVALLSWLLLQSGGVLNPASVYYLVEIVVAALVLGRRWTWLVTALCVAGYGALYLAPTDALQAAQGMHPEIARHMQGMWLAFALTALIIAALVTRLAIAVERRDLALESLREQSARDSRLASLATLAAGAAHELSTPLTTIAVAARELDYTLAKRQADADLQEDARLIRAETERCRRVLAGLAGQSGESMGETPGVHTLGDVVAVLRDRLSPGERDRLIVEVQDHVRVVWPVQVIARSLFNLVNNALQATPDSQKVRLLGSLSDGLVRLTVVDTGSGMAPDNLRRAGEPFFTTKPAGAGTGLGLFVAQSSIEQLGGHLTLTSAEGEGTTATVILPSDVIVEESPRHA